MRIDIYRAGTLEHVKTYRNVLGFSRPELENGVFYRLTFINKVRLINANNFDIVVDGFSANPCFA